MFKYFTEILTKARSNKSANKPDTELNEFELVGAVFFFFFLRALSAHAVNGLDSRRT